MSKWRFTVGKKNKKFRVQLKEAFGIGLFPTCTAELELALSHSTLRRSSEWTFSIGQFRSALSTVNLPSFGCPSWDAATCRKHVMASFKAVSLLEWLTKVVGFQSSYR